MRQKLKCSSKFEVQTLKYWSKVEILVKNSNFRRIFFDFFLIFTLNQTKMENFESRDASENTMYRMMYQLNANPMGYITPIIVVSGPWVATETRAFFLNYFFLKSVFFFRI